MWEARVDATLMTNVIGTLAGSLLDGELRAADRQNLTREKG
jgi:hypothetical protein